ncbi:substrate-binding periplasmic protein [Pseudaeromonas sharmana]|uniref:Substrate-binding periplasmic protein n=1 Tax=Pseudaeromonas sharmana TaxID=328412 RepID=A0ABV8CLB1_9GAMM
MNKRGTRLWLGLWLWCLPWLAMACEVRYFQTEARYAYRTAVLKLLLDKTAEAGACPLRAEFTGVTQDRGLALLQEGRLDVVSMPTTMARERAMRPVRYDILAGLLGYRVLLINQQQQAAFAGVRTLQQLRAFTFGFGSQWADLPLLQYNGFDVVSTPHAEALFGMLARGRFEAFPRGLNEAWLELGEQQARYPTLMVEPTLALYYPWPVYFFVARENSALAERLQLGMQRALADGSLQALFLRYHGDLIRQARLGERRLFRLANPGLPPGTPESDTQWWLPVTDL